CTSGRRSRARSSCRVAPRPQVRGEASSDDASPLNSQKHRRGAEQGRDPERNRPALVDQQKLEVLAGFDVERHGPPEERVVRAKLVAARLDLERERLAEEQRDL